MSTSGNQSVRGVWGGIVAGAAGIYAAYLVFGIGSFSHRASAALAPIVLAGLIVGSVRTVRRRPVRPKDET